MATHQVSSRFGIAAPPQAVIEVPDLDTLEQQAQAYVPTINPQYKITMIHYWEMSMFLLGGEADEVNASKGLPKGRTNLFLVGPPGSGKSSLPEQMCARLHRPVIRVACHSRLEYADLVGMFMLVANDGGAPTMQFVDGALTQAMRHGYVLLLDEADRLPPETLTAMHGVLDHSPLVIPQTGEVVQPHADFRIAATGNVGFHGDQLGVYKGAKRMDLATSRRFDSLLVGYLPEEEEVQLVSSFADVGETAVRLMVSFANAMRQQHVAAPGGKGRLVGVITTDILIRWAKRTYDYSLLGSGPAHGITRPIDWALNRVALQGWPPEDAVVAKETWSNMTGKPFAA